MSSFFNQKYDSLPGDQGGELPISAAQIKPHSEHETFNKQQNNIRKDEVPPQNIHLLKG